MGRLFIKVNLTLIKQYDFELLRKLSDYGGLLRVFCKVRFKTINGWTEARSAILDTGAHTTLIPESLWKKLDIQIVAEHYVRGLVPKKECKINVKVGWATGIVIDDLGNETPEIKFRAFLALVDNIPLIVGFKDLLDRFKLTISPRDGIGYIEF